jgi:xylose isomerase
MDTFALGLINAAKLIEDGRLEQNIKDRYSSFKDTDIGKRILAGKTSLQELFDYAENMGAPALPSSGRQEILESVVNSVIFGKV